MNYLFIDTETFGLIQNKFTTFEDPINWPPIKQIAWQIYNPDGELIAEKNHFRKNENENGVSFLNDLVNDIKTYDSILVGHNIWFDKNVVGSELRRQKMFNVLINMKFICTMQQTTEFCELNNKYPKLDELYQKLFNKSFEGAHDALNDVKATAKCFFKLTESGYKFEIESDEISNYPKYEDYLSKVKKDTITAYSRSFALIELLRLFRHCPKNLSPSKEIEWIHKNYLKIDQSKSLIMKDENLSKDQIAFYKKSETELVSFFNLGEAINRMKDKERAIGINPLMGTHLYLYYSLNYKPNSENDFKIIYQEFFRYLVIYSISIFDENFVKYSNKHEEEFIINYIKSLTENKNLFEINKTNLLHSILLYFNGSYYELTYRSKETIEKEIEQLAELFKTIKPFLNEIESVFYLKFIIEMKDISPDEFKAKFSDIADNLVKKEGCFIATHCYKSYESKEVLILRAFRDEYLYKTNIGTFFIFKYYKHSPRLVTFLSNKNQLSYVIKILILNPIYYFLKLIFRFRK
jgi:DNA polymerase-3 subunit epsilon